MNNLDKKTDYELVELYEEGNDRAFDILLERHKNYVYSYILFLTRDEVSAEDFFQDTFVKAVTAIRSHRYQNTGKFSAWLVRIAHNIVIDSARDAGKAAALCREDISQSLLNDMRLSEGTVETELIRGQDAGLLRELLDYLPAAQREVVVMRYYHDLPFKEIARLTGVSINTSLGRMRYALINLRKLARQRSLSLAG